MVDFTPSYEGHMRRAALLAALSTGIAEDALPARAKAVGASLIDEGRLYSRSTNAELVRRLGKNERTIQRGFGDLIQAGYGMRRPGAYTGNSDYYLPPLWTWNADKCKDFFDSLAVNCHPSVLNTDLSIATTFTIDEATGEILLLSKPWYRKKRGWDRFVSQVEAMPDGELRAMRFNAIVMRRLHERSRTKRAAWWRAQELVYAGVLSERGIIQSAVILAKARLCELPDIHFDE